MKGIKLMKNNKLTHGLLIEDFKQSILNIVSQHSLDIQSKAIVFENINLQIQRLSEQQTKNELEEFKAEQERIEKENENKDNDEVKEVSE